MHLHLRGPTVFVDACRRAALPTRARAAVGRTATSGDRPTRADVLAVGFTGADGRWTLGAGRRGRRRSAGRRPVRAARPRRAVGQGRRGRRHELLGARRPPSRLLLVGLGDETTRDYRRAGAAITRAARRHADRRHLDRLAGRRRPARGAGRGPRARRLRLQPHAPTTATPSPSTVTLTDLGARRRRAERDSVVDDAVARAMASWRARSYALTPSNEKGPDPARGLGRGGRRRRRPRPRRLGRASGSQPRASAASSRSAAARRTTRGCCASTTRPRKRRRRSPARRAGRQGHHLRHRRHVDQAAAWRWRR